MTAVQTTPNTAATPPASAQPGAPKDPSPLGKVFIAAGDIKLSHSVFALPFALLGAFMARPVDAPWPRFAGQIALVVACMVFARSWAMLVNRFADRRFDAANPRTARRAVASGRLSARAAATLALLCAAATLALAGGFWLFHDNPWPMTLALPVLGWLALYSYAKRFTAACHVLLGTALAISPLCAALAIDPAALSRTPALYALSGMIVCWVAGFDIIYALQDEAFDRDHGLHSIPAALGKRGAAVVSRVLHMLAVGSLAGACLLEPRFSALFIAATVIAAGLLALEHVILARRGLAGLPMAFFTVNGVVSCVVGALGIADVLA